MSGFNGGMQLGNVFVSTTHNRGSTAEEIAERALNRIISVGQNSHPVIAEQALAYKEYIREALIKYLREAQTAERTTLCGKLVQNGHTDLARIIGEL